MVDERLVKYIEDTLNAGVPLDQIKRELLSRNWPEKDIIEAINIIMQEKGVPSAKKGEKPPSKLWYLVPIIFSFLGGILSYFILRGRDKAFAKKLLITGFVVTGIGVIASFSMTFLLVSMPLVRPSGTQGMPKIKPFISLTSVNCHNGEINLVVKNFGADPIKISDLKFYIDDVEVSPIGCAGVIEAGSSITCKIGSGLAGSHNFKILGLENNIEGVAVCT